MVAVAGIPNAVGRSGWYVVDADKPPPAETRIGVVSPSGMQGPVPTGRYVVTIADGRGNTQPVYVSSPKVHGPTGDVDWTIDEGPGAVPGGVDKTPPSPSSQLDRLDVTGRVIDPSDTTTRPAKLRDPSTGTVTDLPDPKSDPGGTLKEFGNQLLNIKPDGTYTVVVTKSADPAAAQAKSTFDGPDGARYEYDPNKPAGQRMTKLIEAPPDKTAPVTKVVSGKTYQWDTATRTWQDAGLPAEAKAVAVYGTGPNDKFRIALDDQGNVVSKEENPNFKEAPGTQLTADSTAPQIPILKPDGSVTWVPNQNRVPVGQAMTELMQQAGLKVNAGELSMDDAKNMLTGAINLMNAQTSQLTARTQADNAASTAAQNIITNEQTQRTQGAQTGAGLLQNRVTNAQQMLGSVLNLAGQGQRSGNMGGGLMNAPAGLGEALVGGIQGWTAELGGGQGVYDTAARLVTAADPQNGRSPEAQAAYGVLTQMLERYQQQTGQPHPAVMATQAASASRAGNGFVAPAATPGPVMMPWNNGQPSAVGAPLIAGATPFMNAGTTYYGNGGLPPDQPFVAPVTVAV